MYLLGLLMMASICKASRYYDSLQNAEMKDWKMQIPIAPPFDRSLLDELVLSKINDNYIANTLLHADWEITEISKWSKRQTPEKRAELDEYLKNIKGSWFGDRPVKTVMIINSEICWVLSWDRCGRKSELLLNNLSSSPHPVVFYRTADSELTRVDLSSIDSRIMIYFMKAFNSQISDASPDSFDSFDDASQETPAEYDCFKLLAIVAFLFSFIAGSCLSLRYRKEEIDVLRKYMQMKDEEQTKPKSVTAVV